MCLNLKYQYSQCIISVHNCKYFIDICLVNYSNIAKLGIIFLESERDHFPVPEGNYFVLEDISTSSISLWIFASYGREMRFFIIQMVIEEITQRVYFLWKSVFFIFPFQDHQMKCKTLITQQVSEQTHPTNIIF